MSDLVAWMLQKLAEDRSRTRAGLAGRLGVDRSAVTRMLARERQIKASEIQGIAEYFGEMPTFGFSEGQAPFVGPDSPPALVPVYRDSGRGDGSWLLHRHVEPIDWRPRAPHFGRAASIFGFYAPDDAMAPRYKPGEIVWIDPNRSASPSEDALFVENSSERGAERVMLGELRGLQGGDHVFIQHKDKEERRLRAKRWTALHILPRY